MGLPNKIIRALGSGTPPLENDPLIYPLIIKYNSSLEALQLSGEYKSIFNGDFFLSWLSHSAHFRHFENWLNEHLSDQSSDAFIEHVVVARSMPSAIASYIDNSFKKTISSRTLVNYYRSARHYYSFIEDYVNSYIDLYTGFADHKSSDVLFGDKSELLLESTRCNLVNEIDPDLFTNPNLALLSIIMPKYHSKCGISSRDFFNLYYSNMVSVGTITLSELRRIDEKLWKSLRNWAYHGGHNLDDLLDRGKTKPGPEKGQTVGRPATSGSGRKLGSKNKSTLSRSPEMIEAEAIRKNEMNAARVRRHRAKKTLFPG